MPRHDGFTSFCVTRFIILQWSCAGEELVVPAELAEPCKNMNQCSNARRVRLRFPRSEQIRQWTKIKSPFSDSLVLRKYLFCVYHASCKLYHQNIWHSFGGERRPVVNLETIYWVPNSSLCSLFAQGIWIIGYDMTDLFEWFKLNLKVNICFS
jgi:hypothetical protein